MIIGPVTQEKRALEWIRHHSQWDRGVYVSSRQRILYPEVSGYLLPTLLAVGETRLAYRWARWLASVQLPDGSLLGPDRMAYVFDTAQVVRGWLALHHDLPDLTCNIEKALNWVVSSAGSDGCLLVPSTHAWTLPNSRRVPETIHLYAVAPLLEAARRLRSTVALDVLERSLDYYKTNSDVTSFATLIHFHAYVLEALVDLGETSLARSGAELMVRLQNPDGSLPAYPDVDWVCLPGVAQMAVVWYRLGMLRPANLALEYLIRQQRASGGFVGSVGEGAAYFPDEEVSWAVKFFMDALWLKQQLDRPDSTQRSATQQVPREG